MSTPHLPILIGVFVVGAIVFHALERRTPMRSGYRPVTRRGYIADIASALVDGPVLSALSKIAAFSLITMAPQYADGMATWSGWLQFAVFFVVNDFGRYWLHRWYHESDFLWRFHRVHHAAVELDAISTSRVHVLEAVVKYGLLVLPFHLLGVAREVTLIYSVIDILKGFWHHANLKTRIGPLNYVLNSAELHWWHHSVEARGQRANYGSTLSIWDWLFRTAYWPRGEWPDRIGVDGMAHFPDSWHGQQLSALYSDEEIIAAGQAGPAPVNTISAIQADIQTAIQYSDADRPAASAASEQANPAFAG